MGADPGNSSSEDRSFDLLPAPAALIDPQGTVIAANIAWQSAAAAIPLLSKVGGNFPASLGALCPEPAERLRAVLSGESAAYSSDAIDVGASSGTGRWYALIAASRPGGGASVMFIGVPRRAEEARLSGIIHSAMDAIITVDGSQRVVMFNQAAERIFGVPADEAIGSPLDRFIPERFRKAHAGHVRAFGQTGVSMRAMGRLGLLSGLKADGSEFPIEASISQAITDGRPYYTVILRDISERKKLEAQLLQSQKMEGLGRLAGGIAHDFNNLLMAILNCLLLAGRRLGPGHPAQDALTHAKEAADRAAALTRQLLTFARKQPTTPRVLCLRDIVLGLEPMLRRLISEVVAFRIDTAADTGNVRADPNQLEQVLMNLVVNARDAMPTGGTLSIRTGNQTLDKEYCHAHPGVSPGEYVMLTVTDTGVGMTPDTVSRLFEPFFTTKPPGQGTGLGLAMCHGIVRECGGHIAVSSQEGLGTTMKVYLPRAPGEASAASPPPAASSAGGTETVLLVEGSSMVRDLIAGGLRAAGYTVIAAPGGEEAMRAAERHSGRIDLLVTVVVMPGITGVQLAQALERLHGVARVIYISGYSEEAGSVPGPESGKTAFISKPFTTDALLQKVRSVLGAAAASGS